MSSSSSSLCGFRIRALVHTWCHRCLDAFCVVVGNAFFRSDRARQCLSLIGLKTISFVIVRSVCRRGMQIPCVAIAYTLCAGFNVILTFSLPLNTIQTLQCWTLVSNTVAFQNSLSCDITITFLRSNIISISISLIFLSVYFTVYYGIPVNRYAAFRLLVVKCKSFTVQMHFQWCLRTFVTFRDFFGNITH